MAISLIPLLPVVLAARDFRWLWIGFGFASWTWSFLGGQKAASTLRTRVWQATRQAKCFRCLDSALYLSPEPLNSQILMQQNPLIEKCDWI